MSSAPRRILVTGATGFVGGRLIPRLLARGHVVRAFVRRPAGLRGRVWAGAVEVVVGDIGQPESLARALEGVETAYYLVHGMTSGEGYAQRDLVAARNFAQAAAAAGTRHIVYLGALADPSGPMGPHLRSRLDTGAALAEGTVPVSEFRVGVIADEESLSFRMIRRVTELLPVIPGSPWLCHMTQPLAGRNVVDYLVAVLDKPSRRHCVYEIGGPKVTTYADLMLAYARVRGLQRRVVTIPGLPVWLMALGIALLTPVQWSVARAVAGGLASDSVVNREDAQLAFPDVRLIDFESAAREALAAEWRAVGAPRVPAAVGWRLAPGRR
jgi:uncharacterized protein YbjT (DUF2867 family)